MLSFVIIHYSYLVSRAHEEDLRRLRSGCSLSMTSIQDLNSNSDFLEISCAVTLDRLEVTLYVTLNVTLWRTKLKDICLLDHKDIRDIACTFDQTH